MLIDFFASIGWAYDLKTIPWSIVKNRVKRTGDGSHGLYGRKCSKDTASDKNERPVWGWGDKDMTLEQYKITDIYKPSAFG